MPKAPRKEASTAPFPFVRQFTAPPFFVDLEDAKRKSKLLLDAVQQAGQHGQVPRSKRKPKAAKPAKATKPAKRRRAGKS